MISQFLQIGLAALDVSVVQARDRRHPHHVAYIANFFAGIGFRNGLGERINQFFQPVSIAPQRCSVGDLLQPRAVTQHHDVIQPIDLPLVVETLERHVELLARITMAIMMAQSAAWPTGEEAKGTFTPCDGKHAKRNDQFVTWGLTNVLPGQAHRLRNPTDVVDTMRDQQQHLFHHMPTRRPLQCTPHTLVLVPIDSASLGVSEGFDQGEFKLGLRHPHDARPQRAVGPQRLVETIFELPTNI